MELNLDSFLESQGTSDDDDFPSIPHRTLDEILNDSDSSSSSSSSPSSVSRTDVRSRQFSDQSVPNHNSDSLSKEQITFHQEDASVFIPKSRSLSRFPSLDSDSSKLLHFEESPKQTKIGSSGRVKSSEFSSDSFSLGAIRKPLPPLFGSVRSNAKPGAALAAAAAASRSVPTPHAAAIKSRRNSLKLNEESVFVSESDRVSDAGADLDGLGPSGVAFDDCVLGSDQSDAKSVEVLQEIGISNTIKYIEKLDFNKELSKGDEIAECTHEVPSEATQVSESDESMVNKSDEESAYPNSILSNSHGEPQISSFINTQEFSLDEKAGVSVLCNAKDNYSCESDITSTCFDATETDLPSSPTPDENRKLDEASILGTRGTEDQEKLTPSLKDGEVRDDSSSRSDITELVEDRIFQWETKRVGRKTGKKSRSSLKPLELAEELEKKAASTGLHWEEGAAAQPMRLEGVRRGSTALGYFDIDANNTITRTISAESFRRDHGSPQVVAVHHNFIAVGMSKGAIVAVPSKYSANGADNMDAKMSMLGVQGDRSHAPVTSMCFNQQGDLLIAGYGNGHITVWDVQRAAMAKVITGEHTSPVVHILFLGQDTQNTRQFKAVTGDSKGLVLLHAFSVVPLLNRFSNKTQCLLDGQRTGTVLSASPLLADEGYGGATVSSQGNTTVPSSGISSMMGGVVGGDAGWKLFSEGSSLVEEGVVIFVTHQTALVARLSPTLEVYAQLSRPDGIREGAMPYTAWKYMTQARSCSAENTVEALEKVSLLAIAWDRKVQVAKLVKSELKIYGKWTVDSVAIGVAWLDDQMLLVLTLTGQLYLFAKDGTVIHQTNFSVDGHAGDDLIVYHTHFTNIFGNPEKSYHNSLAVRGATIYILGPMHLVVCRLLPWKERIQVLKRAGDWMGALNMAMTLYDGNAHGVIDLPRTLEAVQEAIMPYLVELLLSYVDEVFSYISVACCNQIGKMEELDNANDRGSSGQSEIKEQFTRVGGVAVEFCVHIRRTDILFDEIFSKFVSVQHKDTFLELLEPYILKDMLGSLPPEIMQALVEHYSSKGWLQRVEQCVLHMDISSLDFNQIVRLCREHGLYGALIYLFNRGLKDFKAPLEELLVVLQNNQRETASHIGYRILVYLKYCFAGLAFPPGHGSLPQTRLASLRAELVQFLLEDSNAQKPGACPNLHLLLQLDTEATLDVLKSAFVQEDQCPNHDVPLHDSPANTTPDAENRNDLFYESHNSLVQETVNALVHIFSNENGDMGFSTEVWPSKKDIGHLYEFIAYFVASKRAAVTKNTFTHILEYLTTENTSSVSRQSIDSLKRREKQVLALLEGVPEGDWDASYVLHLCERTQFYQVCGFIHTIGHQYLAALDSYMKDVHEPIHAFSFINSILLQLKNTEFDTFKSAVMSRIPELVILCREGAFLLVIDHFNQESRLILSELRSYPKSLFLYLKTVIEVHLSGTLNLSSLSENSADVSSGRREMDQSNRITAYLEKMSDLPKLLRNVPVDVTDEMIELYLELLCQYERRSVLKFLETFESYRVEHCLRLCQEYGIIDAAAFLLERVGDVGSALVLTLSGLNDKFVAIDAALETVVTNVPLTGLSEKKEVNEIRDILHACIGLCQRNTPRLNPEESEVLWFRLLDSFCEPLMDDPHNFKLFREGGKVGNPADSFGMQEEESSNTKWRLSKSSHKSAHVLRQLFSQFIKEIVDGMIGYVRLPNIMSKLLSDNGNQEFGDFKLTILGMLSTYGFERRILVTAKSLIEDDTFYTMSLLKKGASHAYAPRNLICCICNNFILTKNNSSTSSSIRVFSCGHATHLQCEYQDNEASSKSKPGGGCPVCMPKKKTQSSRNKSVLVENRLVTKPLLGPQAQAQKSVVLNPYENEALENQQISRFEFLTNLQKDQKSTQLENLPQLRLAPPAVYHEKVKKGPDLFLNGESSSETPKIEEPSSNKKRRELKLRGSSIRFPLKTSIFGKEKTSKQ